MAGGSTGFLWLKLSNKSKQQLLEHYPPRYENMFYDHVTLLVDLPEENVTEMNVRFRTIGDMTCTGATVSNAVNIQEIIEELPLHARTFRISTIKGFSLTVFSLIRRVLIMLRS